jgi:hypothetical protein
MGRDGSASGTLPGVEFTRSQRRRGLVLLGTFVVRVVLARV